MGRKVSIQDIAKAAGVSHTTVSRALRNSPLISREVRERIQSVAQQLDYTPNALAQGLKMQRSNTIGLVVTTIADPFVGRVVRGIEEVAQAAGMSVILSASYNDPEREMETIENFQRRRVDGIIVAAAQISDQYAHRLSRIDVPTVVINHQAESDLALLHSIAVDDYMGARQAVEHLLGLGHRRIGYLGAGNRPRSNRRRLQAYRDALHEAGLDAAEWVRIASPEHRYHSDDVMAGRTLLPELLDGGVTALFCYNDMIAIGGLLACSERRLRVPEQFSLIGFDDIELAQYVTPGLTTIHQPKLRLGQMAMEMLLELVAGREVCDQVLATELILRGTTAGLSGR